MNESNTVRSEEAVPYETGPGAARPANGASDGAEAAPRSYGGRLAFYHPTGSGTGSAIQIELKLNRPGEDRYDCFFLEMARQKTIRGQGGHPTATFDWAGKITVKLDVTDICEFLRVLEGKAEQAGGARGLYHEAGSASTLIGFRHSAEPPGYAVDLSRKEKGAETGSKAHILLTEAEAIALRCVFQSAIFYLVFHRNLEALRV